MYFESMHISFYPCINLLICSLKVIEYIYKIYKLQCSYVKHKFYQVELCKQVNFHILA